jgi:type I restriction enzyme, S subunit
MDFSQDDRETFSLLKGDILVCEGGEVGRTAIWNGEIEVCFYQKAIHRLRPITPFDEPNFFRYFMRMAFDQDWFSQSTASTILHLPAEKLRIVRYPAPPVAEQREIANFLNREAADIDALIAAKQRLLDLLAEKRRAIVAQAVMRGLNPSAPLRPSGIEWLGDIPAHWEALDLKWVVERISSGVSVNATDLPATRGEPGVLKTSAALGGRFLPEENKAVWPTEYERLACPVKAESIIVSRMNTPGLVAESGYVEADYPNLFLPDRLWQIELDKSRAVPRFISQVLSSHVVRLSLSEMATGTSASMKNLSQEDLLNFSIPLPPVDEQGDIVRCVDSESAKLDRLRAATVHSITLLKERRSALIAAAVTGQIDVAEAA